MAILASPFSRIGRTGGIAAIVSFLASEEERGDCPAYPRERGCEHLTNCFAVADLPRPADTPAVGPRLHL